MPELAVKTDWSYRGLRVVTLENRFLRVLILPEAGAKIWQITYKTRDTDLLWNNPRIPPARVPMNSCYDDVWSGGWDELFPNDEVATIEGESYPDHGELWTGEWEAEPFIGVDEVGVMLRFVTPISSIQIEKRVVLRRGEAQLHFGHCFHNCGGTVFPFLWKLHPAMAVSPQHRIDFPPMRVVLEPAFKGTLIGASEQNAWPYVGRDGQVVDLRCIPSANERQLYFFYGTEMKTGWCALTNTGTGLACGLRFDPAVFPCCWVFASYGGWRNYNVTVLEPCTGYPLNFEAMKAAGRHRTLALGETLATDILFTVQEGVCSVANIDSQGQIIPAVEGVESVGPRSATSA